MLKIEAKNFRKGVYDVNPLTNLPGGPDMPDTPLAPWIEIRRRF